MEKTQNKIEKKKTAEWKDRMLAELTKRIKNGPDFYISTYSGLKAEDINDLRRQLGQLSSEYLVLKNAIARIALKNAGITSIDDYITGSVGIAFGGTDPIQTAKVMSKFGKDHEALKFKGGYLNGSPIDAQRVKFIASLPGRNELIAKAVFTIKAPLSNFVGVLSNTLNGFVYVLQAIKDKREKQGG